MKKVLSFTLILLGVIFTTTNLSGSEWVTIQDRVDRFIPTETGGGIAPCIDPSDVECEMQIGEDEDEKLQ